MAHPTDIYIGKRLRSRRELKQVTQLELAQAMGLSFQQIQKYETGSNRISASRIWEISKFLNVAPDFFFSGLDRAKTSKIVRNKGDKDGAVDKLQSELNVYFRRIQNQALRRRFVYLVRAIADTKGDKKPGKAKLKKQKR